MISIDGQQMDTRKDGLCIDGREVVVQGRLCHVAHVDGDGYKFLADPESAIAALHASNTRADLFTFLQRLPETSPQYPYPLEWDNLAVLPISTFDHWWTRQVDAKTRNMVRRAEKKGAVVREVPFDDDLIRGIWEIYNESPVRQGRPFPHYGKDFESLRKMKATFLESSIFIGAFVENQLIGFIKLTVDETRSQAGVMHILGMIQHRDKAPTNGLIAQAVRSCADRGISRLAYANFAYGNKVRSSLSDFKKNNGFQRIDLPRYYVPLTRWGALAFRLGLHRRLAERVPEPVAAKLRELRDRWYQRKLHLKAESV
jgi:hypothetical protein